MPNSAVAKYCSEALSD